MSNGPFKDLEIDFSDMMTKPEDFSARVFEEADKLRAVCKADTSVAALTRKFQETKVPADTLFHVLYNEGVYKYADEMPIEMMPSLIALAKKHVADLEEAFKDRVIREASESSDSIQDKKLASLLYSDLRQAYNSFVKFMNGFKKTNLKELPVLPGNYGSQSGALFYYTYEFKGETFRNPRILVREVCTAFNLTYPDKEPTNYMDVVEWLELHPELQSEVQIKKLS